MYTGYLRWVEKSANICDMVQLSIPSEYRRGFAALLTLREDQVQELASVLEEGQALRSRGELQLEMAAKVESIERDDLEEVIDTLISLFSLRDNMSLPTPFFVDILSDAMNESQDETLALSDEVSRESFNAKLTRFLEIGYLEVAAKAISLGYEQDHILHGDARVLTDIRPIFTSEPEEPVMRGAMVTYTLKVEYHAGSRIEETFVNMSSPQIDQLIESLERARSKAENLKAVLRDVEHVRYVEGE